MKLPRIIKVLKCIFEMMKKNSELMFPNLTNSIFQVLKNGITLCGIVKKKIPDEFHLFIFVQERKKK
jgi:hypothetical protein